MPRFCSVLAVAVLFGLLAPAGCGESQAPLRDEHPGGQRASDQGAGSASDDSPDAYSSDAGLADELILLPEQGLTARPELREEKLLEERYDTGGLKVQRKVKLFSDASAVNHGSYVGYHPNGRKFVEGRYDNGQRTGSWSYWHPNGQLSRTVAYVDGQPHGEWEVLNEEGRRVFTRAFRHGQRHGHWLYFDASGTRQTASEEYRNGQPHGVWTRWYPDGQKQSEQHYADGTLDGTETFWHANGAKAAERRYDRGVLKQQQQWDETGKPVAAPAPR